MSVEQAFNQVSKDYDTWVRMAIPGFEQFFTQAIEVLPFAPDRPIQVLDLGAGTGLFSSRVLAHFPHAQLHLVDLATDMLDVARQRFTGRESQCRYTVADLREWSSPPVFHLAVSSLAIHHLEHLEKQRLFQHVQAALLPGGIFLNLDQIHAPSPELRTYYWSAWLAHVRALGASETQIERSTERRHTYDRDALLLDQLAWLQAAGFAQVDLLSKNLFLGLFYARKG